MKSVLTNADKAKRSLSFGSEQAVRPHSLYREVNDVRDDVERAFEKIEGKVSFPSLLAASGSVSAANGSTSLVLKGANLLAGRAKAVKSFASVAAVDSLLLTSIKPGIAQNAITLTVVAGAGALDVSVANTTDITVTLADGGSTVSAVVTAINADAEAKLLVAASAANNGASNLKVSSKTALEGGTGNGLAVTIYGIDNGALISEAGVITASSDTSISVANGCGNGIDEGTPAQIVLTSHTVQANILSLIATA
jgi:hypothetical protein